MAYDLAVHTGQQLHTQMASLARTIATALVDRHIQGGEYVEIAMAGSLLATTVLMMLKRLSPADLKDVLYVLEHGEFTLPEASLAPPTSA